MDECPASGIALERGMAADRGSDLVGVDRSSMPAILPPTWCGSKPAASTIDQGVQFIGGRRAARRASPHESRSTPREAPREAAAAKRVDRDGAAANALPTIALPIRRARPAQPGGVASGRRSMVKKKRGRATENGETRRDHYRVNRRSRKTSGQRLGVCVLTSTGKPAGARTVGISRARGVQRRLRRRIFFAHTITSWRVR